MNTDIIVMKTIAIDTATYTKVSWLVVEIYHSWKKVAETVEKIAKTIKVIGGSKIHFA